MSGGAYNYAYQHIAEFAETMAARARGDSRRLAFAAHLVKVAAAAKAIEWEDSGDGDAQWRRKVDAVISPAERTVAAARQAMASVVELKTALAEWKD